MSEEVVVQPSSPAPAGDEDRGEGATESHPPEAIAGGSSAAPGRLRAALRWLGHAVDRVDAVKALALLLHGLALAVTALAFLAMNRRFFYNPIGYDEEFFAWGGWSITKGLAPYRDFIEFKPPMVFITHALAQALFGFQDGGYRKFFTIFPLFSVLLLQASLVRRGVGRLFALTVMLAIVPIFLCAFYHDTALTDCESIGLSYYFIGLALLLWEGRAQKWTTVLGGFFFSCCVMSKEPFGPMVIFTWAGLFWMRGTPAPSRESMRFFAKYSLIGVAAFVVLLSAYMVPTGAMKAYIAMVRSYSAIYRDPKNSYCVALGLAHPTTPLGDLKVAWDKIRGSFLNEGALGYLTPLVVLGAAFTFRRSKALFAAMALVALGGLWAPMATNCQWIHYYVMSTAAVVFLLVAGADSMRAAARTVDRTVRLGVTLAILTLVVLHFGTEAKDLWKMELQRPTWQEPVPGVLDFIAKNTVPSDRILTTGPPILYAEADRVSAVRESNIIDEILGSYPGDTDEEKLRPLREELSRNRPKVIVLDPFMEEHRPRHLKTLLMPFIAENHYKKVGERFYLRP